MSSTLPRSTQHLFLFQEPPTILNSASSSTVQPILFVKPLLDHVPDTSPDGNGVLWYHPATVSGSVPEIIGSIVAYGAVIVSPVSYEVNSG